MRTRTGIWVFLLVLISSVIFAKVLEGPFLPDEGLKKFQELAGRLVYHAGNDNPYELKGLKGQCTWFVYAVREDRLPVFGKGHARAWLKICREAGYGYGQEAKEGAIACFGQTKKNPYGHVAFVVKANPGSIEVWDSNYKFDKKVRRHSVKKISELHGNFLGFIYWSTGQTEEKSRLDHPIYGRYLRSGKTLEDEFEEKIQVEAYTFRDRKYGDPFGPVDWSKITRERCSVFRPEEKIFIHHEIKGLDPSRSHKVAIAYNLPGKIVGRSEKWAVNPSEGLAQIIIPAGRKSWSGDTCFREGFFFAQPGPRLIQIYIDGDIRVDWQGKTVDFYSKPNKEIIVQRKGELRF